MRLNLSVFPQVRDPELRLKTIFPFYHYILFERNLNEHLIQLLFLKISRASTTMLLRWKRLNLLGATLTSCSETRGSRTSPCPSSRATREQLPSVYREIFQKNPQDLNILPLFQMSGRGNHLDLPGGTINFLRRTDSKDSSCSSLSSVPHQRDDLRHAISVPPGFHDQVKEKE